MPPSPHNSRLARLRVLRNKPERDFSLGIAINAERQRIARARRAVGGAACAWLAAAPAEFADRCELVRLARGVLTVRVPDDATRFVVDRWLRAGGQSALAARTPATLTRVRIVK